MYKFIAIGDVHAAWPTLWAALRDAHAADAAGNPTAPLLAGHFQVVLLGDLVHPKSRGEYARLSGVDGFDFANADHLARAAGAQIEQLERLKAFSDAAGGNVHILLGNHDAAALGAAYLLGSGADVVHREFDARRGGVSLPQHLKSWFAGFARELWVGRLQFAHAGPLPSMAHYDDLFYADQQHKTWWRERPDLVRLSGAGFGVYGHTRMRGGVYLHGDDFAMIDALPGREYLELMVRPELERPVSSLRVAAF